MSENQNKPQRTHAQIEASRKPKLGAGRPATGRMPIKKIALQASTWAALEALATQQGVSTTEIVRSILEKNTKTTIKK